MGGGAILHIAEHDERVAEGPADVLRVDEHGLGGGGGREEEEKKGAAGQGRAGWPTLESKTNHARYEGLIAWTCSTVLPLYLPKSSTVLRA